MCPSPPILASPVRRSLYECGGGMVADGRVLDFIRRVSCFGMSLMKLDIRQVRARVCVCGVCRGGVCVRACARGRRHVGSGWAGGNAHVHMPPCPSLSSPHVLNMHMCTHVYEWAT